MNRLVEMTVAAASVIIVTLYTAILIPFYVAIALLMLAGVLTYFLALVTDPSFFHLYLAVVFVVVIVRLYAGSTPNGSPIRRGREVTRRHSSGPPRRATTRRSSNSMTRRIR